MRNQLSLITIISQSTISDLSIFSKMGSVGQRTWVDEHASVLGVLVLHDFLCVWVTDLVHFSVSFLVDSVFHVDLLVEIWELFKDDLYEENFINRKTTNS